MLALKSIPQIKKIKKNSRPDLNALIILLYEMHEM